MMKRAAVYFREEKYFICSHSRTREGFWIGAAPFIKVDKAEQGVLGESVLEALKCSEQGVAWKVEDDPSLKELPKPLLELAGVSSWAAFAKGAKCCHVSQQNDQFKVMPTKRSGQHFKHKPELSVVDSNVDANGLEKMLLAALSLCS